MMEIEKSDKERLISFIESNDLDYEISESPIFKFSITAADRMKFFFYKTDEKYVVTKYDSSKDKRLDEVDDTGEAELPYEYFEFKNFTQVLEQLSLYDRQIIKEYWTLCNGIDFNFKIENYDSKWADDIISESYELKEYDNYHYLIYENEQYKPHLTSPYNTLHEVSPLNKRSYTVMEKLYFEIHPESCIKKSESYILKLLCNNEDVLKEYINYRVSTKKGLKLLIESIFNASAPFKNNEDLD